MIHIPSKRSARCGDADVSDRSQADQGLHRLSMFGINQRLVPRVVAIDPIRVGGAFEPSLRAGGELNTRCQLSPRCVAAAISSRSPPCRQRDRMAASSIAIAAPCAIYGVIEWQASPSNITLPAWQRVVIKQSPFVHRRTDVKHGRCSEPLTQRNCGEPRSAL